MKIARSRTRSLNWLAGIVLTVATIVATGELAAKLAFSHTNVKAKIAKAARQAESGGLGHGILAARLVPYAAGAR